MKGFEMSIQTNATTMQKKKKKKDQNGRVKKLTAYLPLPTKNNLNKLRGHFPFTAGEGCRRAVQR